MDWLIELRKAKGFTQVSLSEAAGISQSGYSKVENGRTPSVWMAKKIADILGFPWTKFYEE